MKEKTSITLSQEVLAQLDREAGTKYSRSAVVERVLRNYFSRQARAAVHARDLEKINAAADRLNAVALDTLGYQVSDEE